MIENIISRTRAMIASPDWNKASLATRAGLHKNTLRAADNPDWEPNFKTLDALEKLFAELDAEQVSV